MAGLETKEELLQLIRGLVSGRHRYDQLKSERRKTINEIFAAIDLLADSKVTDYIERHPSETLSTSEFSPRSAEEARQAVRKGRKVVNQLILHTRKAKEEMDEAKRIGCESFHAKSKFYKEFSEKLMECRARLQKREAQLIAFNKAEK